MNTLVSLYDSSSNTKKKIVKTSISMQYNTWSFSIAAAQCGRLFHHLVPVTTSPSRCWYLHSQLRRQELEENVQTTHVALIHAPATCPKNLNGDSVKWSALAGHQSYAWDPILHNIPIWTIHFQTEATRPVSMSEETPHCSLVEIVQLHLASGASMPCKTCLS